MVVRRRGDCHRGGAVPLGVLPGPDRRRPVRGASVFRRRRAVLDAAKPGHRRAAGPVAGRGLGRSEGAGNRRVFPQLGTPADPERTRRLGVAVATARRRGDGSRGLFAAQGRAPPSPAGGGVGGGGGERRAQVRPERDHPSPAKLPRTAQGGGGAVRAGPKPRCHLAAGGGVPDRQRDELVGSRRPDPPHGPAVEASVQRGAALAAFGAARRAVADWLADAADGSGLPTRPWRDVGTARARPPRRLLACWR